MWFLTWEETVNGGRWRGGAGGGDGGREGDEQSHFLTRHWGSRSHTNWPAHQLAGRTESRSVRSRMKTPSHVWLLALNVAALTGERKFLFMLTHLALLSSLWINTSVVIATENRCGKTEYRSVLSKILYLDQSMHFILFCKRMLC